MLSTATTTDFCARTCAQTDRAQSESTNTALQLEASRRECADLKAAYSEMAASLWRAEQVVEHLEYELAELKAGPQQQQPPPPSPPQRKRKGSASAATTPASSPAASPAGSATASDKPDKPKRVRVPKELASQPVQFEGKAFFEHFEITNSRELQQKLAAFLIAKDRDIDTAEKRRVATNQCKFKADQFLQLLWTEVPGTPRPYTPGNVDEFFAFLMRKDHNDMGKNRTYHNHDHRIGTWLWPSKVTDYGSFQHASNKYVARQARGAMTGVRAVHGLYEIFKGNTKWPVADCAPLDDAAPSPKKRKVRAESSLSSEEGAWSCADNDTDGEDGN